MTSLDRQTIHPAALPASSGLLQDKIAALRRRHLSVAVLTGLSMAAVVSIELLALAMFLDWWLDLPRAIRAVLLLGQIGVFTYIIARYVAWPMLRQPDDDELALLVERSRPEFRSRLIASMQLTRPGAVPPGASVVMVRALLEETEQLARPLDFREVVPTERLRKMGLLAVAVPLIALLGFLSGRDTCTVLLKRVLLSNVPVPRKTRVIVAERNKIIGRGDSVRLEAFAEGIIPGSGKVEVRYRSRRPMEYSLEQNRENRRSFGRTIENVQDSFSYQIYLNDGVSPLCEVKAIPRPTVASIECQQIHPSYTGIKPARRSLGDLTLLAGSILKLKVTATKDLQAAILRLVGPETVLPMQLSSTNRRKLTSQFTVPTNGMTGFSIQMLDTEEMESRDSAVYRVEIVPDKVPSVRVTYPDRKEELVTRYATMLIGFAAQDDFGIARVRLHYKIDTVDNGAEKAIELDLESQNPTQLARRFPWKIGEFTPLLAEGSTIEYWIEVTDINDTTGPGVGKTEHQLAKVVSQAEKTADLLNRASDALSGITDVALDQERLNRSLGAIIREKVGAN
jgi:hypothetical protein